MLSSLKMQKKFFFSLLNVGNTLGFYDFFERIFSQTVLASRDVEFNEKLHDT